MNVEKSLYQLGRTPHLHEQIVDVLASEIRAGQFQTNEHLIEESVAERFGVSRGPVRRAFRELEDEGLLTRSGARGMAVFDGAQRPAAAHERAGPALHKLENVASWEGIYRDVAKVAVVHAAYGDWRVVETELALSYGVSRTVAREVLARLEHRGILRKDSRYRWRLPKLSYERVANLYEMRRILEPIALRQASERVPRELLLEMRAELEAACDSDDEMPMSEYDRLERRLHIDLLSYARNDLLSETLRNYHALLITNVSLYPVTRGKFGREPFPSEHLEIVNYLIAGRVETAADKMMVHLSVSLTRATARLAYMAASIPLEPLGFLRLLE